MKKPKNKISIKNIIILPLIIILNNFCVSSAKLTRVYEENPFLNGEFQAGNNLPQGPVTVNDPYESPPIIDPIQVNYRPTIRPGGGAPIGPSLPPTQWPAQQAINDATKPTIPPTVHVPLLPAQNLPNELLKYCLQPRGTFQGRYCNSFVNCWDGNNVVEQYCGATLMFNPRGYCDYAWNVNCYGKPIKDIPNVGGSNGWPSDGSYIPPSTRAPPTPPTPPGSNPTLKPIPPSTVKPPFQPTPPPAPPIIIHPINPTNPPYRPGRPGNPGGPIFTIEPPGFGNPEQDPTLPPIYRPPHDHDTHTPATSTSTTTTWRPTIGAKPTVKPVNTNELKKYCLYPRGQFEGPHCQKFINCWDEVVIEQDCPFGLNFNPIKRYCDFPQNYPCRIVLPG